MPLFGWQGFSFEHPEDWAPVMLTGNRQQGYARLESSGRTGCQVRWQSVKKSGDLRNRLDAYFQKLQRDAKKSKDNFRSEIDEHEERLVYRWQGYGQGRGSIFYSPSCKRVFILEVTGGRKDSLLPQLRQVSDSFQSSAESDLWSVFNLKVALPKNVLLMRKSFLAGKTQMEWRYRTVGIKAERWAFAEQLLAKHELLDWAANVLKLPQAAFTVEPEGLRFERGKVRRVRAIVKHDEPNNQLVLVRTTGRSEVWRPDWHWLA